MYYYKIFEIENRKINLTVVNQVQTKNIGDEELTSFLNFK